MGGKSSKDDIEAKGTVNNVIVTDVQDTVTVEHTKELVILVCIILGIFVGKITVDYCLQYHRNMKEKYSRRNTLPAAAPRQPPV